MQTTRRELITCLAALLVACGRPQTAARDTDVGTDDDPDTETDTEAADPCDVVAGSEADGWARLDFDRYADLQEEGGFVFADVDEYQLIVARAGPACAIALGRFCTHEGARLVYQFGKFVCPRHGSVFLNDGSAFSGPAEFTGDLEALPAGLTDSAVMIDRG